MTRYLICYVLVEDCHDVPVFKVREDSADKVFIPGWQRQLTSSTGTWLSTMSGECIGLGDLVVHLVPVTLILLCIHLISAILSTICFLI